MPHSMDRLSRPLRLCLIGWGAISQQAARLLLERDAESIEIIAVGVRDKSRDREGLPRSARLISVPAELADLGADLVAEAAGQQTVPSWGEAALKSRADFLVSSTGAFSDERVFRRLVRMAEEHERQLIVSTGALAGIDALAAAALLDLNSVEHKIVKPPAAWMGTPAEDIVDLPAIRYATSFFTGTARNAARLFPQNANSTAISALAGIGLDNTIVTLVADPSAERNIHNIVASGAFGQMDVVIENVGLPANPKSSAMTALNMVRHVEARIRPVAW